MKKVVLIPDSFKGTLSSVQICDIIKRKINEHFKDCEVISIPIADGGEGTVDCFLSFFKGEHKYIKVKNPYFEDMDSFYGIMDDGNVAIIEMAACAGLPLVEDRKNPCKTTTYGVGQLILDAAKNGAKKIIVGLGGSCTNDGGCGAASAVGVKFLNKEGKEFIPVGETMHEIVNIDITSKSSILKDVEIITMCDITNPMHGLNGAAHVFAPQKGADSETVLFLDSGLKHLANIILNSLEMDLSIIPGAGAAGAMGAGMIAFFNSKLQIGINAILDLFDFNFIASGANMIITGEGKIDTQSLKGKVVIGVAKKAKELGIPVIVVAGGADKNICEIYDYGITSIFTINRMPEDFAVSRYNSRENMIFAIDNILRLIKTLVISD